MASMADTNKRLVVPIYQLKVTLRGSKPPIWRRIQVAGDVSLGQLHHVLQSGMGWYDCHLHQFEVAGISYSDPDQDYGLRMRNERIVRLTQVAPRVKDWFLYEYDFGDSWMHRITVEAIMPPEPGARYPRCLAGRRARPPENCGGMWRYSRILEALKQPDHPDRDALHEWLVYPLDPEAFDLEAINERLKSLP
jgi:hypothetical protein